MIISRKTFFSILFGLITLPFLLHKIIWLAGSSEAVGIMGFVGKAYSGQIVHEYSVVKFGVQKDTFWFNGNDNILYKPGEKVPVRYQVKNPREARINIFSSIWGDTVVFGGIPLIILLIVIMHPQIVPYSAKILINRSRPFIQIR